ncbi:hypothetical protein [Mucilaginibacter sp. PAMB04168]
MHTFYEINISNKSLILKGWIEDKQVGSMNPYLVSRGDKIYTYGN